MTQENEWVNNLTYENKQMGDFIQLLGFSPDEITSLIINGTDSGFRKAIARVKRTTIVKISSDQAQKLLDFLNYEESDVSFHHEFDEGIIYIRDSITNVVQFLQIDVNPELVALEVHYGE